jgi:hypothetical protein
MQEDKTTQKEERRINLLKERTAKGSIPYKYTPNSRSKYTPHVGVKQLAKGK